MTDSLKYFWILTCTWTADGQTHTRTLDGSLYLGGPASREAKYTQVRASAAEKIPADAAVLFFSLAPDALTGPKGR